MTSFESSATFRALSWNVSRVRAVSKATQVPPNAAFAKFGTAHLAKPAVRAPSDSKTIRGWALCFPFPKLTGTAPSASPASSPMKDDHQAIWPRGFAGLPRQSPRRTPIALRRSIPWPPRAVARNLIILLPRNSRRSNRTFRQIQVPAAPRRRRWSREYKPSNGTHADNRAN
jgi:hypothetical protein